MSLGSTSTEREGFRLSIADFSLVFIRLMRHKSIAFLTLLVFFFVSFLVDGQGRDERLHPYQYLIPQGYVGWIRVDFNVKDAPPLPVTGNYYVLKIDHTGRFQTSTSDAYGPLGDLYFYECGNERERLVISQAKETACRIWGNFEGAATLPDATSYSFRYFFVGPKEEYQKYQFSGENLPNLQLEKDGYPRVGSKVAAECDR